MITVNGTPVRADIFPDKTSQVWKLPPELTQARTCEVVWRFEEEREVIDLLSLRKLLDTQDWLLSIPYFPYARQDKPVSNNETFSRSVILGLLKTLGCRLITTVDVHSGFDKESIYIFNREVSDFHRFVLDATEPNVVVFPDKGARLRYPYLVELPYVQYVYEKTRNPLTGEITGHGLEGQLAMISPAHVQLAPKTRFLIVDDLCDGGATFLSIKNDLDRRCQGADVSLAVTHGVFSKGKTLLTNAGIELFYTNSLLANPEGFKVC